MKLSNLIHEKNTKERISSTKKVQRLLEEEFLNREIKLYRGTRSKVYEAEIRKIRKDREPLDTPRRVHYLLNGLNTREEYSKYPSRGESKFASTKKDLDYLRQYGSNIVYVFPLKNAKIASLDNDAYNILQGIAHEMPTRLNQLENFFDGNYKEKNYEVRKKEYGSLYKFTISFVNFKWREFKKTVAARKEDIIDDCKKSIKNNIHGKLEAESIIKTFNSADDYFDELFPQILPNSKEIMFDGNEYLSVRRGWFDKNFEYKKGWKLK